MVTGAGRLRMNPTEPSRSCLARKTTSWRRKKTGRLMGDISARHCMSFKPTQDTTAGAPVEHHFRQCHAEMCAWKQH